MAFFDKIKDAANRKPTKLLCLFLCIILLCGIFSGCGNNSSETPANTAQVYIDMAQEYIANGNYDAAADILEKGYASTGDQRINDLLQTVQAFQSATSPTVPVVTEPSATVPSVTVPPTTAPIVTVPATSIPVTTVPQTTTPANTSTFLNTHSGSISINSANISLQDSAVLYVTLSYNGSVSYSCDPKNIVTLAWGDFDYSNTVPLYITASQNGTARIYIYETNYPNNYLTVNVTVSNHVTIDTSKASGILANMGLTEEEFRQRCIPLHFGQSTYGYVEYGGSTDAQRILGTRTLREYPKDYIGNIYYLAYYKMENFAPQYYSEAEAVSYKGMSTDGYPTYIITPRTSSQDYLLIFDYRDDVYNPTISIGSGIAPYMIFTGIQTLDGIDYLCFNMISVDKT